MLSDYKMLQRTAYDYLKGEILSGRMSEDTIYSETRIAQSLSISRTPVRDALVRLSDEKYIDIFPSRGFILHKPTEKDLRVAYQTREAVETYCALCLARHANEPDGRQRIRELEGFLRIQKETAELACFREMDVAFHTGIVRYLENDTFNVLVDQYMHFFIAMRVDLFQSSHRRLTATEEHEAILYALKQGDPDLVLKSVKLHIDRSLEMVQTEKLQQAESV
ncbi:MAG: GntR family transcriptional regulator [Clostridia bacterium]|nr:GntR family transcriptional regulator [Clostridia bacterium]